MRASARSGAAASLTFEGGDRLAGYVAHELRTSLATQRSLLELALADRDADVATWREIGEDVLRACRDQERVLEACLTLVRSQRGPERCEPVDLAGIAAEALRAHDPTDLESVLALEPARTAGDPDLLERLAANLVSNAIRHNIVGGRVEVATRTEAGRAALIVANTGPLVPAAELERLFQPFRRLNPNLGDGVGLGLAIVDAIAAAHGARVTARTRAGGGLEINVSFPAALDRRAARRPANRKVASNGITQAGRRAAPGAASAASERDHVTLRTTR